MMAVGVLILLGQLGGYWFEDPPSKHSGASDPPHCCRGNPRAAPAPATPPGLAVPFLTSGGESVKKRNSASLHLGRELLAFARVLASAVRLVRAGCSASMHSGPRWRLLRPIWSETVHPRQCVSSTQKRRGPHRPGAAQPCVARPCKFPHQHGSY